MIWVDFNSFSVYSELIVMLTVSDQSRNWELILPLLDFPNSSHVSFKRSKRSYNCIFILDTMGPEWSRTENPNISGLVGQQAGRGYSSLWIISRAYMSTCSSICAQMELRAVVQATTARQLPLARGKFCAWAQDGHSYEGTWLCSCEIAATCVRGPLYTSARQPPLAWQELCAHTHMLAHHLCDLVSNRLWPGGGPWTRGWRPLI